jgi:hypothetical protein
VIKIRYSDLPAGLHVRTVVEGRHTILYLLPGLSAAARRAAIHRARSNARVGYGPRLPAAGVAFAVITDQFRTTLRNGLAAARLHPALAVPAAIVVLSVAVTYLLFASVSIQLPAAAGPGHQFGVPLRAAPSDVQTWPAARGSRSAIRVVSGRAQDGRSGDSGAGHRGGPHPGLTWGTRPSPSPSASSAPPSPGPSPGPSPDPSPSPSSGPSPGPSPDPSPSPRPSPASSGLCVDVGSLGVCLKV